MKVAIVAEAEKLIHSSEETRAPEETISSPKLQPSRLEWVDALRGLAAISVVLLHFLETEFRDTETFQSFENVFNLGKFGVVLFFCISGFVIPRSIKRTAPAPLIHFWISRFFRLYPAYWLSMVAALLFLSAPYTLPKVLANVTMMPKLFGMGDLVGVYWTLQIELIFYLLVSVLFACGRLSPDTCTRVGYFCLLAAVIASMVRFHSKVAIPVAIPLALSLMHFSAALSESGTRDWGWLLKTFGVFAVSMVPISMLAYDFNAGHGENWLSYLVSYSLAIFVFLVVRYSNSILVFLGRISYSLYLMHATVGLAFLSVVDGYLGSVLSLPAYLVVTIGVSTLCFYGVEQPSIALAKRINARMARQPIRAI